MNPLRIVCLLACLVAAVCALPNQQTNSVSNKLKPRQWLQEEDLESIPSLDEISLQQLESMPLEKGAKLMEQIYHLARISQALTPSYVPSPSNIPVYIVKPNGQKITANLNTMVDTCKQQQGFGDEEVTILITGLPQDQSKTVAKATKKLVQAYMQRYHSEQKPQSNKDYDYGTKQRSSSEEQYTDDWTPAKNTRGDLIVIDLGATLTNFKRLAMLDVPQTGNMIGKVLVELTDKVDVPHETVHIVAQGIGAHVAGIAANLYTRLTGHQIRRITALDPSKIYAKDANRLTRLSRGDADFVDGIHTSARGMGTHIPVGDIDFYPNGPSSGVPGAQNVVEAAMRATRYFAESVRPGNERNFPAVAANSLSQYQSNNGHGPRAYMGIATEFDQQGDYILQVNAKAPFGRAAPAQKQNTYHGEHQAWKNSATSNQDY